MSFKNDIMKFIGKWMKPEKYHPDWEVPEPEKQIWYMFTYMWMWAVKSMINKLQSRESQKAGIEKETEGNR